MPAWNVDGLQGGMVPSDMVQKRPSFGSGELDKKLESESMKLLGGKNGFSDISLGWVLLASMLARATERLGSLAQ